LLVIRAPASHIDASQFDATVLRPAPVDAGEPDFGGATLPRPKGESYPPDQVAKQPKHDSEKGIHRLIAEPMVSWRSSRTIESLPTALASSKPITRRQ